MFRLLLMGVLTLLLSGTVNGATTQGAGVITVANGVTYQFIGQYNLERLNKIGTTEIHEFKSIKSDVTLPPAKNEVKLYRISYRTVIPERGNHPVEATGLIAIPDKVATTYPLVSYQHGTVFSRDEVPSFPEKSTETRLMIAQFAGHGYIVIAADYIGKGSSMEPDSYMVKESTSQACYDMLVASKSVIKDLKLTTGEFFLSGWSQGAWNTMVFRNRLEQLGVPIKAAATASTPNDISLLMNRWLNNRLPLDTDWLVGVAAIQINSYERYYSLPGLSAAAIRPQYLEAARGLYENRIGWGEASKIFPKSIKEFFQPDFSQAVSFMANRFYRQLSENQAYQWRYSTPSRYYYGKIDEVVPPYVATLPAAYQELVGGAPAQAVFAGDLADHRGTFIFGMLDQKRWFDKML